MDWVAVVAVGLVATGFMTLVSVGAGRLGAARSNIVEAIGSFVIPEPIRRQAVAALLHVAAGVGFTAVYAYVFDFIKLERLRDFVAFGLLFGLVHGFFVSYFMLLNFATFASVRSDAEDELDRTDGFRTALANVLAHLVFGLVVGVGLGLGALEGHALLFAAYGCASLLAIIGLASLLVPTFRSFRRRRQEERRDKWPPMPAIERGP